MGQDLGPLQQRWVDALRSGNYKQAHKGKLKSAQGYCCLGVACQLFAVELALTTEVETDCTRFNGCICVVPEAVIDALGLQSGIGGPGDRGYRAGVYNLSYENDTNKKTFEQIADHVTTYAHFYFKEPK